MFLTLPIESKTVHLETAFLAPLPPSVSTHSPRHRNTTVLILGTLLQRVQVSPAANETHNLTLFQKYACVDCLRKLHCLNSQ